MNIISFEKKKMTKFRILRITAHRIYIIMILQYMFCEFMLQDIVNKTLNKITTIYSDLIFPEQDSIFSKKK